MIRSRLWLAPIWVQGLVRASTFAVLIGEPARPPLCLGLTLWVQAQTRPRLVRCEACINAVELMTNVGEMMADFVNGMDCEQAQRAVPDFRDSCKPYPDRVKAGSDLPDMNRDSHGMPGCLVTCAEMRHEGFIPLTLQVRELDGNYAFGRGCEWTTLGEVSTGPGVYAFTVGDDDNLHVTYVGLTEELWMVTKGRLPSGGARPGQRYGRPRYAGSTRQRINGLVAEQLLLDRYVRHWVSPLAQPSSDHASMRDQLVSLEERLIRRWDLRRVGWNRG